MSDNFLAEHGCCVDKSEIRNQVEIQKEMTQTSAQVVRHPHSFWISSLQHWNLFRISGFGFRIWELSMLKPRYPAPALVVKNQFNTPLT